MDSRLEVADRGSRQGTIDKGSRRGSKHGPAVKGATDGESKQKDKRANEKNVRRKQTGESKPEKANWRKQTRKKHTREEPIKSQPRKKKPSKNAGGQKFLRFAQNDSLVSFFGRSGSITSCYSKAGLICRRISFHPPFFGLSSPLGDRADPPAERLTGSAEIPGLSSPPV